MLTSVTPTAAHDAPHHPAKQQRLPKIAPAPAFALTSQDGTRVSLADLRGKVVAVTFIYTAGAAAPSSPASILLVRAVWNDGERLARLSKKPAKEVPLFQGLFRVEPVLEHSPPDF
jgi:hypothetical protein